MIGKIPLSFFTLCSIFLVYCAIFYVQLFLEITNFHKDALSNLGEFKEFSDKAWNLMIGETRSSTIQDRAKRSYYRTSRLFDPYEYEERIPHKKEKKTYVPDHKERRTKKKEFELPDYCQCAEGPNTCPPGPPGPPGLEGRPGTHGIPGNPGKNGITSGPTDGIDYTELGCIKCKAGPPGTKGRDGNSGYPGPDGKPGTEGTPGVSGRKGPKGPPGDRGRKGNNGSPGKSGRPGRNGKRQLCAKGHPGVPGRPGQPGRRGRNGEPGSPGSNGPEGPDGTPGKPGRAGPPGSPGQVGYDGGPGDDAAYCPCPPRIMYIAEETTTKAPVQKPTTASRDWSNEYFAELHTQTPKATKTTMQPATTPIANISTTSKSASKKAPSRPHRQRQKLHPAETASYEPTFYQLNDTDNSSHGSTIYYAPNPSNDQQRRRRARYRYRRFRN